MFRKSPKVGLMGVIGTAQQRNGAWFLTHPRFHRGHWQQVVKEPTGVRSVYMMRNTAYAEDLVTVDGFCLFVRGVVAKTVSFDEVTYPDSYHLYDSDYCFSVLEAGWRIATHDILMEHGSTGVRGEDWELNHTRFLKKWALKGYKFPVEAGQFESKRAQT